MVVVLEEPWAHRAEPQLGKNLFKIKENFFPKVRGGLKRFEKIYTTGQTRVTSFWGSKSHFLKYLQFNKLVGYARAGHWGSAGRRLVHSV